MSIPIPVFGTDVEATLFGAQYRLVHCESCNEEFVTLVERRAIGRHSQLYSLTASTYARETAMARAVAKLEKLLENDVEPVPCPNCGWYQPNMVKVLSKPKGALLRIFGGIGCVVAALFCFANFVSQNNLGVIAPWSTVIPIAMIGPALLVGGFLRRAFYSPNNTSVKKRLDLAFEHARSLNEFFKNPILPTRPVNVLRCDDKLSELIDSSDFRVRLREAQLERDGLS